MLALLTALSNVGSWQFCIISVRHTKSKQPVYAFFSNKANKGSLFEMRSI
jgi:hypothetical protein